MPVDKRQRGILPEAAEIDRSSRTKILAIGDRNANADARILAPGEILGYRSHHIAQIGIARRCDLLAGDRDQRPGGGCAADLGPGDDNGGTARIHFLACREKSLPDEDTSIATGGRQAGIAQQDVDSFAWRIGAIERRGAFAFD
jgi:hypothetical protein